ANIGSMREVAVAQRSLLNGHSAGANADLARLPMVNFGQDDNLQFEFLRRSRVEGRPPMSVVPGTAEFVAAVAAGLGWGMVPVMQLGAREADLAEIGENPHIDVPMYSHHWKLASVKWSRLTEALARAAEAVRGLSQVRASAGPGPGAEEPADRPSELVVGGVDRHGLRSDDRVQGDAVDGGEQGRGRRRRLGGVE